MSKCKNRKNFSIFNFTFLLNYIFCPETLIFPYIFKVLPGRSAVLTSGTTTKISSATTAAKTTSSSAARS